MSEGPRPGGGSTSKQSSTGHLARRTGQELCAWRADPFPPQVDSHSVTRVTQANPPCRERIAT